MAQGGQSTGYLGFSTDEPVTGRANRRSWAWALDRQPCPWLGY